MKVTVVGAGVIGLTSAIRLREAGFDAHIVAAEEPTVTAASAVAGAIWYPPGASAETWSAEWGRRSLDIFTDGARRGLPGLMLREMVEFTLADSPDPWWADGTRGFRRCRPEDLRAGYQDGYEVNPPYDFKHGYDYLSKTNLAYDMFGNHSIEKTNEWMNVLFMDGHVEGGEPGDELPFSNRHAVVKPKGNTDE